MVLQYLPSLRLTSKGKKKKLILSHCNIFPTWHELRAIFEKARNSAARFFSLFKKNEFLCAILYPENVRIVIRILHESKFYCRLPFLYPQNDGGKEANERRVHNIFPKTMLIKGILLRKAQRQTFKPILVMCFTVFSTL